MKYFMKVLETIDNKEKTYLNSESASVLRYVFFSVNIAYENFLVEMGSLAVSRANNPPLLGYGAFRLVSTSRYMSNSK